MSPFSPWDRLNDSLDMTKDVSPEEAVQKAFEGALPQGVDM